MQQVKILNSICCLLTLFVLVSCGNVDGLNTTAGGGIGGTGIDNNYAGGGTGGTGISFGKITGFGSVFVNGVEFDTKGATISKDGVDVAVVSDTEDQENLSVGMVVTVRGIFNTDGTTGTADRIEFRDNLEGPINSADSVNKTFEVLGQIVAVDTNTRLENKIDNTVVEMDDALILNTLADYIGYIVEVSGFADANGTIRATYIDLKKQTFVQGTTEIELKGIISNLDTLLGTFTIGSLTIDYSNAYLKNPPNGGLANGLYVEVKSIDGFDQSGVFIASDLEVETSQSQHSEGDKAEIEGVVNSFTSLSDFKVNGYSVAVTAETKYEKGTEADIKLNARLEVKGTVNSSEVLIVREISFESEKDGESDSGSTSDENGTDSGSTSDGAVSDSGSPSDTTGSDSDHSGDGDTTHN